MAEHVGRPVERATPKDIFLSEVKTRDVFPLLVLHSPIDEVIPFEMGRSVFDAAGSPSKRFVELKGGHNDGFAVSGDAYITALRDFMP